MIVASVNVLQQLQVVLARLELICVLNLLAAFKLFSYCALHFRNVLQLWLELAEDLVFFSDHFGTVNVVPLQSLKHALIQLRLVDLLISCKLKVGVLLGYSAEPDSSDNLSASLERSDVYRAVCDFSHLLYFCLQLVL